MPTFERRSVVKVPFPYTDLTTTQRRPALVVATGTHLLAPHLLWAMMITSAENRGWPGDILVTDIRQAGLPAPSVVRTANWQRSMRATSIGWECCPISIVEKCAAISSAFLDSTNEPLEPTI
jgi:hypothetical protein